ncbi:hypothetical protein BH11CYA1_BH11CYA1_18370 [soil metagenome]
MNTIEFKIQKIENTEHLVGQYQIRIFVDGIDYIGDTEDSQPPLGHYPPDLYRQTALLNGGILLFAICCCGCIGCGDHFAKVVCADGQITWKQHGKPDVTFEEKQYRSAIAEIKANTSWESEEDAFQRQAKELDFSGFELAGWQLIWISSKPEKNSVSLTFQQGMDDYDSCSLPCSNHDKETILKTLALWAPTASPKDFNPKPTWNSKTKREDEQKK